MVWEYLSLRMSVAPIGFRFMVNGVLVDIDGRGDGYHFREHKGKKIEPHAELALSDEVLLDLCNVIEGRFLNTATISNYFAKDGWKLCRSESLLDKEVDVLFEREI